MSPELFVAFVVILMVVGGGITWAIAEGRREREATPSPQFDLRQPEPAPPPTLAAAAPQAVAVAPRPTVGAAGSDEIAGGSDETNAARGGAAVAPAPQAAASRAVCVVDATTIEGPRVGFADVAGLDEAIAELREIKDYLADPERFRRVGAELPRGILLWGEPGNGKTLLGRALAGEAGVPFYCISAAGFVEQYVGLGAARIRQVFDEVKAAQLPAIFSSTSSTPSAAGAPGDHRVTASSTTP